MCRSPSVSRCPGIYLDQLEHKAKWSITFIILRRIDLQRIHSSIAIDVTLRPFFRSPGVGKDAISIKQGLQKSLCYVVQHATMNRRSVMRRRNTRENRLFHSPSQLWQFSSAFALLHNVLARPLGLLLNLLWAYRHITFLATPTTLLISKIFQLEFPCDRVFVFKPTPLMSLLCKVASVPEDPGSYCIR